MKKKSSNWSMLFYILSGVFIACICGILTALPWTLREMITVLIILTVSGGGAGVLFESLIYEAAESRDKAHKVLKEVINPDTKKVIIREYDADDTLIEETILEFDERYIGHFRKVITGQ